MVIIINGRSVGSNVSYCMNCTVARRLAVEMASSTLQSNHQAKLSIYSSKNDLTVITTISLNRIIARTVFDVCLNTLYSKNRPFPVRFQQYCWKHLYKDDEI